MNYTKGDWKVTNEGLVWAKQNDGLQFHHRIALIEEGEEAEANANLIATAPNCYKELVHADELICQLCVRLNPQHENCTSCQERDSRLQALAKAEGKEV